MEQEVDDEGEPPESSGPEREQMDEEKDDEEKEEEEEEDEGEMALWSPNVQVLELEKGERGLGFSILDYQVGNYLISFPITPPPYTFIIKYPSVLFYVNCM